VRSDVERLRDILDAIEQIRRYSTKGRAAFDRDELIQVWITHHLARLGEAAARISADARNRHPAPWKEMIGMRNILVHEYFRIDAEVVWRATERLSELEQQVRSMLRDLESL
jgi:uncharacterized protein with HEPN domain